MHIYLSTSTSYSTRPIEGLRRLTALTGLCSAINPALPSPAEPCRAMPSLAPLRPRNHLWASLRPGATFELESLAWCLQHSAAQRSSSAPACSSFGWSPDAVNSVSLPTGSGSSWSGSLWTVQTWSRFLQLAITQRVPERCSCKGWLCCRWSQSVDEPGRLEVSTCRSARSATSQAPTALWLGSSWYVHH